MSVPVAVGAEVLNVYNELKMKRKHRWIILKIEGETQVVIEAIGEPTSTYAEFMSRMPKNEPRYDDLTTF